MKDFAIPLQVQTNKGKEIFALVKSVAIDRFEQ